ncbi:glycosyltransferase [Spirosoma aureum]|uniref:Glycosyltransferase n=1 Tax=Spirosoma aureum TaxID=2692134 RepID=A0A6G9AJK2_9BACT|nr:glycosyltransferase [Spirosoma aureum]QIP12630.1 glycosyltransferase [Spirosoma aureum]
MIPVYNCAHYLKETLTSVLMQDMGPSQMQIEVIDDASTDGDIASLVAEIGQGRITYFRQPHNVGSLRNFETCLNRSRGQLIHLLHGDDKVYNGYYNAIASLFDSYPEIGAAFCRHNHLDENGHLIKPTDEEASNNGILSNWLMRLAIAQRIQYCSITVKREVYEQLGGFYGVTYGEDWEMWTRIAHKYPIAYTPNVLAAYRLHSTSISTQSLQTGQNLRDLLWVIETIQQYLPESERYEVKRNSLKKYAHSYLGRANHEWVKSRDKQIVYAQIKGCLHLHQDMLLYLKAAYLYSRLLLNY